MNENVLTYKGYTTRVEYSVEDKVLFGKIAGISDLVTFESDSPADVEQAFHDAVDDYLAFCKDIGQNPDKEYRGSFNVRVTPALHRALDLAAYREGISMNQFIENALSGFMASRESEQTAGYQTASPEDSDNMEEYLSLWNTGNNACTFIDFSSAKSDVAAKEVMIQ